MALYSLLICVRACLESVYSVYYTSIILVYTNDRRTLVRVFFIWNQRIRLSTWKRLCTLPRTVMTRDRFELPIRPDHIDHISGITYYPYSMHICEEIISHETGDGGFRWLVFVYGNRLRLQSVNPHWTYLHMVTHGPHNPLSKMTHMTHLRAVFDRYHCSRQIKLTSTYRRMLGFK